MMRIDWTAFTPWPALVGGLMIGAAAALYLLGVGRVAGISGIVGGPLRRWSAGGSLAAEAVPLVFIVGLLVSPWIWQLAAPLPAVTVKTGPLGLVAAGLLVGVGTRMAQGCTSGHGVCGLSRLSPRSLVNVLVFMAAGMATVAAWTAFAPPGARG